MAHVTASRSLWKKSHYLNKMSFGELVVAYFQYYAVQAYILLAALCLWAAFEWVGSPLRAGLGAVIAVMIYPLAWYGLHRWVLHGRWLYRSPLTARVWKRIHYDHHQDPHHLEVLFGALYTTLPTVVVFTAPVGFLLDGWGGAAASVAAGLIWTLLYEFSHCVQHLSYKPKNSFLARIKARHMAHHFHDEHGNFGITDFTWDRLFGTFYEREERPLKSPTVFNLGYNEAEAARYPWVAALSGGVATGAPRDRRLATAPVSDASAADAR